MADNKAEELALSLTESLADMDSTLQTTSDFRSKMIGELGAKLSTMDFTVDEKSDPDLVQAKARLLSEFRQLMNDHDSNKVTRVKILSKQKDLEDANRARISAVDILCQISLNQKRETPMDVPNKNIEEVEAQIDKVLKDQGCIVLDTELEMGGNQLPEKKEEDNF